MQLEMTVNGVTRALDIEHLAQSDYDAAMREMRVQLALPTVKNRDAIADGFMWLLGAAPNANASDLWHHVLYRIYCEILPAYRPQDPKQSWVRASGDALELVLERVYQPQLTAAGVRIEALIGARRAAVLDEMGLLALVGRGKLSLPRFPGHLDCGDLVAQGGVRDGYTVSSRVSAASSGAGAAA